MASTSTIFGKKDIWNAPAMYREWGNYVGRLEQYERALPFFDQALKRTPDDKWALRGRAWARSKFCQYEGALKDVEKALHIDPSDLYVLAHKSLNYYLSCEFEEALLQNCRLMPRRKQPDSFFVGALDCADAIHNCLGDRAGRPLRDHFLIIRTLAWKKSYEDAKPYYPKPKCKKKKKKTKPLKTLQETKEMKSPSQEVQIQEFEEPIDETEEGAKFTCDYPDGGSIKDSVYTRKSEENIVPPKINFSNRPLQRFTTNIENYMAEKYLNILYRDKLFLKNLNSVPGVASPNEKGTKEILKLAKKSFKHVNYKQELLRTRRPFYFLKYEEVKTSGQLESRQRKELILQQKYVREEANAFLKKMEAAIEQHDLKRTLELVDMLQVYCESKPRRILPDREHYLSKIYEAVCQIFYDLKRLNNSKFDYEHDKRIAALLGVPMSREPSEDSVISQFKGILVNWKRRIEVYSKRLTTTSKPEELSYLFYELSRYHTELKKYELARIYARKCVNAATKIDNLKWVFNAMFMLVKLNILQQNKNDAKHMAKQTLNVACKIGDETTKRFMTKAIDVIDKIDFGSVMGLKELKKREDNIVKIMVGNEMKKEAETLFRTMQNLPGSRRMSVMPGIRIPETRQSVAKQRASILPAKKPSETVRSTLTSPRAKAGSKGVAFVELIKHYIDT